MLAAPPRTRPPDAGFNGRGPVARLAVATVAQFTGVRLPPAAVGAAFRLFGLRSGAAQLRLLGGTVASPRPALRRLRRRAVQAVADYRAIVRAAPHLRPIMKLDFTILLGLYGEALGVTREQAMEHGLVESYCHLAALVDAYDDVLDTPEARTRPLRRQEFLTGKTGELRERLAAHFAAAARRQPAAARLIDDLAAFEDSALAAHRRYDLGAGLDATLADVVQTRAATSGLLLHFAAHVWSTLLALPAPLAASSEQAAATFGVVAQFADDVVDWTTDDGVAQNLLGAALGTYPAELAACRAAAARRPGWSLPATIVRRLAPCAWRLLARARAQAASYPPDPRYTALRQFGDDVYGGLLPALPAIDFRAFDSVRCDVQEALAKL